MIKKSYKTKRLLLIQPNMDMATEIANFYMRNKKFLEITTLFVPNLFIT